LKTIVVMPTYNEAKSIKNTIHSLFKYNPEVHLLVVDDGSPDGTASLVTEIQNTDPRVHLLNRSAKEGLGKAYVAGFKWAFEKGFELIVEMDADGSHRAQDLPSLLEKAPESDLVIGSRWIPNGRVENWPISRQLISRIGNSYARGMLGTKIKDMTSGFRVYRADFLESLISTEPSSAGYAFQVELAFRASSKGRVAEVPIVFVERTDGESKMTLAIVLEALAKVTFWGLKRVLR
jgi:dolichol-phosphate mannosyltransferase